MILIHNLLNGSTFLELLVVLALRRFIDVNDLLLLILPVVQLTRVNDLVLRPR